MSARKRMRLEGGGNSSSDEMLLEPTATTINDLPSEVMKNIFSFVGKGNYYFIGPVSKDFCFNYLTMDVIEDKFAHKMDYLQAIGKNKITTAEAISTSFELAEYCFFKAPEVFQEQVVKKAIRKGKRDIVNMGDAMGIGINELIFGYSSGLKEIAEKGNLEMFKLLLEIQKNAGQLIYFQYSLNTIIRAAAANGQLHLLKWLHRNNMFENMHHKSLVFFEATKNGNVQMFKWAQNVFNCPHPNNTSVFVGTANLDHTAKSNSLELIEYFRSQEISLGENAIHTAAKIGNIALLEYILENELSNGDPNICANAITITNHEKALEVLQWLHEHNVPWDERACAAAAQKGNLKALKYLRSNNCPWNQNCFFHAIKNGHYEVVNYCLENRCPRGNGNIHSIYGNDHDRALKVMKLLRKFSVPWHADTCSAAVITGNFEVFKWAVSQGCPWERQTCANYAARHGNIELLKWMRSQSVVFEDDICIYETIKWLRAMVCQYDKRTFVNAKTSAIFEYCIENDVPFDDHLYERVIDVLLDPIRMIKLLRNSGYPSHPSACTQAVRNGDLKLLRWLRFNGFPWNESVCNEAVRYDNFAILKYAHENGCQWTKETYAYCLKSNEGLHGEYDWIPSENEIECSPAIFAYLQAHKCPQPDPSDWNITH